MWRVGVQDVKIVDPLWADQHGLVSAGDAPLLDIAVFGPDSTEGCVAVELCRSPLERPRARWFEPQTHTTRFAASLLAGDTAEALAALKQPAPIRSAPALTVRSALELSSQEQAAFARDVAEYQRMT